MKYFPVVDLPVILSEELKDTFESENEALPFDLIDKYMVLWENSVDEYTEFIPCFRLPEQENFQAIVYWKGSLLKYEFIMVTLDKKMNMISRKVIASTIVENDQIKRSVASIEPDLTISIIAGHEDESQSFEAGRSVLYSMEIMANGELVFDSDYRALHN